MRSKFAAIVALLVAACSGAVGARGGLSDVEVAKLPPNVAESYELFAHRCSRCHTLARPLSAQIRDLDHWRLYVTRMRRQPGSGISEADAEKILIFLDYYSKDKYGEEKEGAE